MTHWDGYDTHYTERYMGSPQTNPEGYQCSSVMAHVDKIEVPCPSLPPSIHPSIHPSLPPSLTHSQPAFQISIAEEVNSCMVYGSCLASKMTCTLTSEADASIE